MTTRKGRRSARAETTLVNMPCAHEYTIGARLYTGHVPAHCDLCLKEITSAFVDGRTYEGATREMPGGRHAAMCLSCHKHKGVGLGEGNGVQYERSYGGVLEGWRWERVKG